MKKILLVFLTIVLTTNIAAQLNGDGYYRVQNYVTKRYVYIIDNKEIKVIRIFRTEQDYIKILGIN